MPYMQQSRPATAAAAPFAAARTRPAMVCAGDGHFLVLVDSYSNWFEVDQLFSLSSSAVIEKAAPPLRHLWVPCKPAVRQRQPVHQR